MKQTNETITADGGWSIKFELNAEDADASSSLGMKVNPLHPEWPSKGCGLFDRSPEDCELGDKI